MTERDLMLLSKALTPSPWLQRAINRIHSTKPYPSKEERKKIFEEEKKKG